MFEVPDPADIFIDKSRDLLYSAPTKTECGRNSAVECHLAKVDVDGSNPFARSRKKWRHSQVAKAAVCKTVIHRFKSGCRLQTYNRGCRNDTDCNPFHFVRSGKRMEARRKDGFMQGGMRDLSDGGLRQR